MGIVWASSLGRAGAGMSHSHGCLRVPAAETSDDDDAEDVVDDDEEADKKEDKAPKKEVRSAVALKQMPQPPPGRSGMAAKPNICFCNQP